MDKYTLVVHLKGGNTASTVVSREHAEFALKEWAEWVGNPLPNALFAPNSSFLFLLTEIAGMHAQPYQSPVAERTLAAVEKLANAASEGEEWRSNE